MNYPELNEMSTTELKSLIDLMVQVINNPEKRSIVLLTCPLEEETQDYFLLKEFRSLVGYDLYQFYQDRLAEIGTPCWSMRNGPYLLISDDRKQLRIRDIDLACLPEEQAYQIQERARKMTAEENERRAEEAYQKVMERLSPLTFPCRYVEEDAGRRLELTSEPAYQVVLTGEEFRFMDFSRKQKVVERVWALCGIKGKTQCQK